MFDKGDVKWREKPCRGGYCVKWGIDPEGLTYPNRIWGPTYAIQDFTDLKDLVVKFLQVLLACHLPKRLLRRKQDSRYNLDAKY